MPEADTEVEVLIVGGGPVGLAARALLDRWGVSTLLVEKHAELSPFPRSRLVNVRSMEIFRQLGLAEQVAARAFAPQFGRIRFRDTLHDPDFASAAMVGINEPITESPVIGVVTSQDRLEPTLVGAAEAPVRFGAELVGLVEEADSVVASLVDRGSGEEFRVRARYVLAADGARSTVREVLGIDLLGPGAMRSLTTVVFDADLQDWAAEQPGGVYVTARGMFLPIHPEGTWAWMAPTPEDAAGADWADMVLRSIGPGLDVRPEVLRVQHWMVTAFVAERFRRGRVLLAGDAAHTVPPAGGLGMNAGLADVHNLCWKLAGVLHGWARPGLLDSYETERQPVAHATLRQAVANSTLMQQAQVARQAQLQAGDTAPEQIELPWSERYFAQLGFVLGVAYHSDAVFTDGAPSGAAPDTERGTDYVPSREPGHRMPHLWLKDGHSTLDVLGDWFTLLTPDPASWEREAVGRWPLRVEALPDEHAELFGTGARGALLVRPDGHVAARWHERAGDPSLQHVLTAITGG